MGEKAQVLRWKGKPLDGKQGSDEWILGSGRLERSVGRDAAGAVAESIRLNRTETWVVAVRPDGSTELQVLDSKGNTKNVDTSKILSAKGNISGAQI